MINYQNQKIISYGKLDQKDNKKVDGKTIFEIGSISKVFTSILLADMIQRREVGFNDQFCDRYF
ncbi:serine hydrolase [Calothrix sp. UHCC 0171]|uniref:serine hydrolase n=1 Tax=Calothrix sp. UHCC 0171 TaxID=3110245 RepID=UPI002B220B78|nr:serine hydrolase [Calothrix sp. UHCC 0171]MEA5572142.1 serine hydrolase [Calothrix sp. UHCC 0171]